MSATSTVHSTPPAAASTTVPGAKPGKKTTRKKINFEPAKKAIHYQHLSLRVSDCLTERYSLVYLPPTNPMSTACWHYEKGGASGPARHIITFGENLANNKREGCDLGDYAKAYHRHEAAHSLWTERDLVALNQKCESAKIPFGLLNIFEDARIEQKWRDEFGDKFEWSHYEEIKPVDGAGELSQRAIGAFQAMIQCEGDPTLLADVLKDVPEAKEIRETFYDRAIGARSASELIPLMQEFVGKYGLPKNMEQSQGGARATAGDMKAGLSIATDAKMKAELIRSEKSSEREGEGGIGEKTEIQTYKRGGVLTENPHGEIDKAMVGRLVKIFQGVFRTGPQRYKRETPSKRISVRDFALERPKIYRAVEHAALMRSKTNVVFDCSGSMQSGGGPGMMYPYVAGRHLVLAMAELARAGQIEGNLILSVVTEKKEARHQSIALQDVTEAVALKIGAYGHGEGLKNAMDSNATQLIAGETALVITDGNITDDPIDRALWHRRGVFTLGCYVGSADRCPRLRNWFDAPMCRATPENLALAIAQAIRQRSRVRRAVRMPTHVPSVTRSHEIAVAEAAEHTGAVPAVTT